MGNKKKMANVLVSLLIIGLLSISVIAQKRPSPKRPSTTPVATAAVNAEIRAGVEKVTIQLNNVARFLYLLGSVAKGIEDVDTDPKASRTALDRNLDNKAAFIQTIRNLKAGMATLEVEFRTKPALQKYLLQIQGITELNGQAEELALAGKYTESGRPLVALVGKLADALASMP